MTNGSKVTTAVPHRSAGVLLHVTSLPTRYGIGDLGPDALKWVDLLASNRLHHWQILPLGASAHGSSPYQCYSAFAGSPMLISPELLRDDGLVDEGQLKKSTRPAGPVDYPAVEQSKRSLLRSAWDRFSTGDKKSRSAYDKFCRAERGWLDDFALFMALTEAHGTAAWSTWPADLARRKPAALAAARDEHADAVAFHQFQQFIFFRQWTAVREYAAEKGVKIIGDVPIFVSGESADVWSNPGQFLLDKNLQPKVVAGVPPDYFSTTGQRWGNPLYDWRAMEKDGFRWWIDRLRALLKQADLIRIDHFRGLAACWHVPADAPTAERGKWVRSPGEKLLAAARQALGRLPLIAEDLGVITPDVEKLRDDFDMPGMRVLQFAFGGDADNPFLPYHHVPNSIVYTGTHDNDTTRGWAETLTPPVKKQLAIFAPDAASDPVWAMIRLAWSSVAKLAVVPAQDVLELGSQARINTPGNADGNWQWRLPPDYQKAPGWKRLADMTTRFGRDA